MKGSSDLGHSRKLTKGGSLPPSVAKFPREDRNRPKKQINGNGVLQGASAETGGDDIWQILRGAIIERVTQDASTSSAKVSSENADSDMSAGESNPPDTFEPSSSDARWIAAGFPKWKRALDIVLVVAAWPIWFPLMLFLMLAVKISSPGPIFYRQERVGLRGKRFMLYKLRSMRVNADTTVHESHFQKLMREGVPMIKLDAEDPRIVPWGRFLRATGLDELPQIFNVLRGEMSLVGPRPCTSREFENYQRWQKVRVLVPPGLTGFWQVNGKNKTTFNEMVDMDIHYAQHMSLLLDIQIILRTFPVLGRQVRDLLGRPINRRSEPCLIPSK